MNFSRPRTDTDRARAALSISLDGPDEDNRVQRAAPGVAFAVVLLNIFNVGNALYNPSPVSRDVNIVGLGFDDHHAGARERMVDKFDDAVEELGHGWVRQYKQKLVWAGFFNNAKDWFTRGALASQYDLMIVRLSGNILEISGFYVDRQTCRLVTGYAQLTQPTVQKR